ncbi:MAG: PAS domain-containing protein, partial [Gammaproteobacteria bacterium]
MFDLHPGFARALLETLPGGVAFIDRHGRVQWASAAFAALLGTD